jgi:alpha-beta hydrolase superfamily lysophospholipase
MQMPVIEEKEYTFPSANHFTKIHVHEWIPDCDLNGVVQIVHGVAEYIERYDAFARFLCGKGFAVVGNDHLGHGQSIIMQEDLGYFDAHDGWNEVVCDIEQLRAMTAARFPDTPYFLFGHSMGSFLTRTFLIDHPEAPLAGVILSGTGQNPAPVVAAGKLICQTELVLHGPRYRSEAVDNLAFGSYNKNFQPQRTKFDWLSRDTENVDKYAADPLCGFLCTVSLYRDMMGGLQYIGKSSNLAKMNKALPIYFMSGDKDPVGGDGMGVAKVFGMFKKAGMRDVFYKFYKDGRHEMLNEINRDQVMADIADWLFKKIG